LVAQRDENIRYVSEEKNDTGTGRGAICLLEKSSAQECERYGARNIQEQENGKQDRIRVVNDSRLASTVNVQFNLVADHHENDSGQEQSKCLDVPAQPVDPGFHSHQTHGLLDSILFLVHDGLGRQDNRDYKRNYDYERKESLNDSNKVVVVVGREVEAL
jgi:hypothetical protein